MNRSENNAPPASFWTGSLPAFTTESLALQGREEVRISALRVYAFNSLTWLSLAGAVFTARHE